jgi:hypothetical protein
MTVASVKLPKDKVLSSFQNRTEQNINAQVVPVIPGEVMTHLPLQVSAPSASPGCQTHQFQHHHTCKTEIKTLKATRT